MKSFERILFPSVQQIGCGMLEVHHQSQKSANQEGKQNY